MSNKIAGPVIIILILASGYFVLTTREKAADTVTLSNDQVREEDLPLCYSYPEDADLPPASADWKTYREAEFVLRYPNDISLIKEGDLYLMKSSQEANPTLKASIRVVPARGFKKYLLGNEVAYQVATNQWIKSDGLRSENATTSCRFHLVDQTEQGLPIYVFSIGDGGEFLYNYLIFKKADFSSNSKFVEFIIDAGEVPEFLREDQEKFIDTAKSMIRTISFAN